ncbi:unnamed protein product [Rhodiola kirilowii]
MGFLALTMLLGIIFASVAYSQIDQCNTAADPFDCREFRNLTYPFWRKSTDHQGPCRNKEFELLNCNKETDQLVSVLIIIKNQTFIVKSISLENKTMTLSLPFHDPCFNVNMSQVPLPHRFQPTSNIDLFFGCNPRIDSPESPELHCGWDDWIYWGSEMYPTPHFIDDSCKIHFVLINNTTLDDIRSSTDRHELWYKLLTAGKPRKGKLDIKTKLIIGVGVSGGTVLIMLAIFAIYLRRRKTNCYTRNMSSDPSSSIADPEKLCSLYGVKFFTYEELEKATDNFNENREIGDGGFGTVYLGKLEDGRTVAVKRLYENNYKRVEQFLNEVEILARLHHQNLVMLYGCTSRHSRELLLVYEYISNGTVADHLHGEKAKPGSLSWQTRLKIAVETASALKYLHASDIIHRDVKTNNILLEDNFCVKVADFGLSRLFPLDVTHVTTAPQGTPGYVDPEYRQCYQLTDKSDVYSFGVVLAELISSKPAVDLTRHRHEINLSNMAINKIQNDALEEFVDPSLGFDRDCNVSKSITAVAELAFQCLQSDKDMRPSMQEALQILMQIHCGKYQTEDNAEELEIFSDEFVLLKSGSLSLSPDSAAVKRVTSFNASNTGG